MLEHNTPIRFALVSTSLLAGAAVLSLSATAEALVTNHWKLDETAGSIASPFLGSSSGTLSRASFGAGQMANGVTVQPSSRHDAAAHVSFPGSVAAFGINDFTVAFWYKTSFAVANHLGDVLGNRTATGYGNYFSIRLKGDGKLTVELSQDAAGKRYAYLDSGTVKVNDNRWHHIAVTRSLGFVRLYVDGAPLDYQLVGPADLTGAQPLRLGRSLPVLLSNFDSITASYDDVRIYNEVLDTASIHQLFENGANGLLVSGIAKRYAPVLRFDRDADTFPMSAQDFYDDIIATGLWVTGHDTYGNDSAEDVRDGLVPTYYEVDSCGDQLRINYWWFYGYQHQPSCSAFGGDHHGDWEHVMVTLSEWGALAAVTYFQHTGQYTRLAAHGGLDVLHDTHPVVYAGKTAHGSYHNEGGIGTCGYYDDWRNHGNDKTMHAWSNLVDLEGNSESWIAHDRVGAFSWGWGDSACDTHPTRRSPSCSMEACASTGCYFGYTQCKAGDVSDGTTCWVPCRPEYTDGGVTCTDWSTRDTYAQQGYRFDYTLPTTDDGLVD